MEITHQPNQIKLRDFPSRTLEIVSQLINRRVMDLREFGFKTKEDEEDLASLLEFQTQCEYAKMLVLKEEKTLSN